MSEQQFTNFEEIQIDVTETEAWNGESRPLVPAGDYNLTVVAMNQKTSESSGNSYIEVEFVVADGDQAGGKVWNNYSLSAKALGRIKSLMVACHTQLDKIVPSQFIGQTIRASIVHTEGDPRVDGNGNPLPTRTFANVINEQPLEVETKAATKAPPITNKPATKPANNAQPRRA